MFRVVSILPLVSLVFAGSSHAQGAAVERCAAFNELKELVSSASAEDLRQMSAQLAALPEDDLARRAEVSGLPLATVEILMPAEISDRLFSLGLLGGFVEEYHPELFNEFFESMDPEKRSESESLSRLMIDGAISDYESQCAD